MEQKKYNWLKVVGAVGAGTLIVFGSFANVWRTIKLLWEKKFS